MEIQFQEMESQAGEGSSSEENKRTIRFKRGFSDPQKNCGGGSEFDYQELQSKAKVISSCFSENWMDEDGLKWVKGVCMWRRGEGERALGSKWR